MSYPIRLFDDRDWEPVAAAVRDAFQVALTVEMLREDDARHDPKCFKRCWVAEADGEVVAYGRCIQYPSSYHPRRFEWEAGVLSAFRRRGIGSALLRHALTEMRPYDPLSFSAGAREDRPESVAFLEGHGFVETMRNFESVLRLPAFEPGAFADAVRHAEEQGYTFRTYTELAGTPDLDVRLHRLIMELWRDVPSSGPKTEIPLETWVKVLHRSQFRPDLYFLAFKDGEMVGVSNIWASDEGGDVLDTGLTGMRREHRGRGLSKALKVRALAAAKAGGYSMVKTWNETHNERMLAVNEWLGFERKPGWIAYRLDLAPEENA